MKLRVHALIIFISFIIIPILTSCGGESDSELALLAAGEVEVVLDVKMPSENIASKSSIIDRLLRFFTTDAVAQSMLVPIFYMTVEVTGDNMVPTTGYYYPTTKISLNILPGTNRKITVTSHVYPGWHPNVLTFKGSTTLDLIAGEIQIVTINMGTGATKLLVPDYITSRLIQIDSISGANWTAKYASDFSPALTGFRPYDIDFDQQGRILILNYYNGGGVPKILRIDNINSTAYTTIVPDTGAGGAFVQSIAYDQKNGLLYYNTTSTLYRYDGSTHTTPDITGINSNIWGIAVDDDGILYIGARNGAGNNTLFKYNPATTTIVDSYTDNTVLSSYMDVRVHPNGIYVSNLYGGDGYKIVQFDTDLNFIKGYGTQANTTNNNPGMFYGAHKFVAVRNTEITLIDDHQSTNDLDKLISMLDINGSGWTTFGSGGNGTNQFRFYYHC